MDEDGGSSIPYVGRLRKLVTFLAPLTWCEVLRRVLHIFRADLSADFMRDVFGALERWDFGSLEAGRKLEVIVFLVKKCFKTNAFMTLWTRVWPT